MPGALRGPRSGAGAAWRYAAGKGRTARGATIPGNDTFGKAARRERIVRAAMDLADEGGYEVVGMRELADRADVALGTLYNHFTSKDHLLAVCWLTWMREVEKTLHEVEARGDTPAERVIDLLTRFCEVLATKPRLLEAILTAANSNAPEVTSVQAEVATTVYGWIDGALRLDDPELSGRISEALAHVLHSVLLSWVHGHMDQAESTAALRNAIHLMLDPR